MRLASRIVALADRSGGPGACWPWRGTRSSGGYGMVSVPSAVAVRGRASRPASRVVLELRLGRPLRADEQADHICRNRPCVNPHHLRPLTPKANTLAGWSPPAVNARKTQCPRGHPLSGPNLLRRDNRRECKECLRVASTNRRHAARWLAACARCGALPGEPCITRAGAASRVAHRFRGL